MLEIVVGIMALLPIDRWRNSIRYVRHGGSRGGGVGMSGICRCVVTQGIERIRTVWNGWNAIDDAENIHTICICVVLRREGC